MINTLNNYIDIIKKNNIEFQSIIEIGSRDGNDADFIKKSFQISDSNVHIIEPNPICFNDIILSYPQYNTYEVAISNKNGISTFYQVNTLNSDLNGMSSLLYRQSYEITDFNVKKIEVQTKTAKQFILENNIQNYIIKLDVEGFTFEVLESFEDKLKDIIAIHLESEEYPIWENQKTTHDVFELLSKEFICVYKKRVTEEGHHVQYDEIWINKKNYKYTLDNYFDKIFIINLDRDIDRRNNIISQLEKYNINNYQIVSGTIITEIPDTKYWRNFNIKSLSKKYILGSLGARNSHWRIMELALKSSFNKILILEDDIIFNENPNTILENNKDILNHWDMLYFGGTEEHHYRGQIVGAYAYAVNEKLMEEIYYMLPLSGMELDNFYAKILFHMSYNYSNTGKYRIIKTNPFNSIEVDFSYQSNIR